MKLLKILIREMINNQKKFSNWKMPSLDKLKLEYKIEDVMKGNHFFDSEEAFLSAIQQAQIITISSSEDINIGYRSATQTKEELLDLIKGYRSYPEFRNEKTIEAIYDGFKNNLPMDYPIVIEFKSGKRRIFSGNTRMDVAFQLGIDPKVLVVKI
jgi:hypothetical protein